MARLMAVFRRLRAALGVLIRAVQRVVMAVSLFLVYFIGVGASALLARLFQRSSIRWDPPGQPSYWHPAEGYEPDRVKARWQT